MDVVLSPKSHLKAVSVSPVLKLVNTKNSLGQTVSVGGTEQLARGLLNRKSGGEGKRVWESGGDG